MSQGIQIGDAVLKLFVDWTEINNVSSDLPSKLKPASDAAASLGKQFDSVGASAEKAGAEATAAGGKMAAAGKTGAAGTQTANESVQALNARIKQLEAELGTLEDKFHNAGRKASSEMHEARGSVALLGEEVGIRVPRHLQGFLAGLPGVTAGLSAAFAPIAILAFIDILEKIPGKLAEIEDYLAGFDEAKKKAFAADTTGFISQLNTAVALIKEETIQQHTLGKAGIDATRGQIAGLSDYQKKLGDVQDDLNRFKRAIDEVSDPTITQKVAAPVIQNPFGPSLIPPTVIEKSAEETRRELEYQFKHLSDVGQELSQKYKISFPEIQPPPEGASEASIKKSLGELSKAVDEEIKKASNEQASLTQEGIDQRAHLQQEGITAQVAALKRGFDKQIADIEAFKAQERLAYAEGKISFDDLSKAEVDAAHRTLAAQLQYKEALLASAKAAGDSAKIQTTSADLAIEKTKQNTAAIVNLALAFELVKKVQNELKDLTPQLATVQGDLSNTITKGMDQAAAAAQVLGFTFSGDVYEGLRKAQEAYTKLQKSGHAAYVDLLQGQMAVLRAQIAWDREFGNSKAVEKEQKELSDLTKEYDKLTGTMAKTTRTRQTWDSFFADLIKGSISTGAAIKEMGHLFAESIGESVAAAVMGSQSFGAAMEGILKAALASLAGQAVVKVLEEIAKATSDFATAATLAADPFTAGLAPGFIAAAHAHLVAAAKWGAIGVGSAIGGAAIPSGGSSYSPGGDNTSPSSIGVNGQAGQQPSQTINTTHLGNGAVVTKRIPAVIGDDPQGGNATEAVIPLDNERATGRIADAMLGPLIAAFSGVSQQEAQRVFSPQLISDILRPQSFSRATVNAASEASQLPRIAPTRAQETHHHYESTHVHVEMPVSGVYSDSNIDKLAPKMAREISKQVSAGRARLKASTSYRVTKRG